MDKAIKELIELASKCEIPQGVFDHLIDREKKFEAQSINKAGIESQLAYLAKTYGQNNMAKFTKNVEEVIMDHARRGKTVQCSICDCTEFLDKCHVKGKQQYVCRECHSHGKDEC